MSVISPYFHPAKIVFYDKQNRTANVAIAGLTDGVDEGITAMLAYPIGDDDLDTERELIDGADVWVFFEQGDTSMPVIAFYRRHGGGSAVVDVRRIRQKNIELLARASITLNAKDIINMKAQTVSIDASTVNIKAGSMNVNANVNHTGNQTTSGTVTASNDVVGGGVSLKGHTHSGVRSGSSNTGGPN
ncbi:hypothetical protein [Psychrobacter sanguinis]|uniref:hypothetical protein n=1 Tax=Psychrobacter sanguinis TaxID=861445 RepID=UPI001918BB88|nr:hypothetical protein [Psychrobacter sanguinis]MCC3344510.1 hypothetical protein [Psychrobacter sanguinis]